MGRGRKQAVAVAVVNVCETVSVAADNVVAQVSAHKQ